MTAFVACLTMDANRQKAGRIDWCCCFTSQKYLEEVGLVVGVNYLLAVVVVAGVVVMVVFRSLLGLLAVHQKPNTMIVFVFLLYTQ